MTGTLETEVERLSSKAADYETATNFEATKQSYINKLSSIKQALQGLEQRLDRMEFYAAVYTDVLGVSDEAPTAVKDVRRKAESVVDYEDEYYYELAADGETDQYEQRIRQVQANAEGAIEKLEDRLRKQQQEWEKRVSSARDVQRLFGESTQATSTFNDIEAFVERRMWDESESIMTLDGEWQGLQKSWKKSGADWDTLQAEYSLSDHTIEVLQELATGSDMQLSELDEATVKELFSVDELKDVVKMTI